MLLVRSSTTALMVAGSASLARAGMPGCMPVTLKPALHALSPRPLVSYRCALAVLWVRWTTARARAAAQ